MHRSRPVTVEGVRALRRRSLTRRVWCDPALPSQLVRTITGGEPDRLLFQSEPLQIKDRCVVARHDSTAGPLLIKRHTWGGFWRTARMAFRPPAARRCAELGLFLNEHGIPTPRPRAYVDFRLGPWTHRSYLVSDFVEGESLYRYIRFGSQSADELRHLARQVATIWQSLVDLNVSHNDMKPENFIVDADRNIWLIDLEKVHLGGSESLRARQLFDIKNFLHVRGWHLRPEARSIFAEAFAQTRYADWLRCEGLDPSELAADGQQDQALSVAIICEGGINMAEVQRAIDSVGDIADEVVLGAYDEDGRLTQVRQIEILPSTKNGATRRTALSNGSDFIQQLRSPWVLILRQSERVTPFLAKELQQRISDQKAGDRFDITIETQLFGRSLGGRSSSEVRLLRRSSDLLANVEDLPSLLTTSSRAGMPKLAGTIQNCACATVCEYIARLNDETTSAAAARLERNESARFGRAAWYAMGMMLKQYFLHGGIRSGSVGLQSAALNAAFRFVEEAKLYQMAAQFRLTAPTFESQEILKMPTVAAQTTRDSFHSKAA